MTPLTNMMCTTRASTIVVYQPCRKGMGLLEVLIASGILVVGLVSVAALLPAAGARLAEATLIDRAGTLSANCYADLWNRNMLTASLFAPSAPRRGVILIEPGMQATMFPDGALPRGFSAVSVADKMFQLPDNVHLENGVIESHDGGVSAMASIMPVDPAVEPEPGTDFRVTIVIFRKTSATSKNFQLANDNGSVVYRVAGATESDRKQFFPACSWVLVLPPEDSPEDDPDDIDEAARWLHVASSWSAGGQSFLQFSDPALAAATITGNDNALGHIYGFSRLVRVDERTVTLE